MKDLPPAFRTIPAGTLLVETLTEAFPSGGWVHAVGFVEQVELKLGGDGADVRRTFSGRFALAQLSGPIGGPYGATLSRLGGDGPEVLAGILTGAISAGVSAVCLSPTGARLGAEVPPVAVPAARGAAPVTLAGGAAPVVPEAKKARPMSSFAARVGVGAPNHEPDDDDDQPQPERGDLVQHFAFGQAEVLSVDGERLVLRDLFGPGRIREIALDRLTVTGPVEHGGKRLFRLERR